MAPILMWNHCLLIPSRASWPYHRCVWKPRFPSHMAMTSYFDIDRLDLISLSLPLSLPSVTVPILSFPSSMRKYKLCRFTAQQMQDVLRFDQNGLLAHRCVITAVAQAEQVRLGKGNERKLSSAIFGLFYYGYLPCFRV